MKRSKGNKTNAAIFIPHLGCPHKCSFCDQHTITKKENSVSAVDVYDILERYTESLKTRNKTAEIAFFGGTFTALNVDYITELLTVAENYIKSYPDIFTGIRCSTRPDCINENILNLLKEKGVTAIELGAQSMDDDVLVANGRGHTSDDVKRSAMHIKSFGFELGVQMMTGLYRDTPEKSLYTANELIKLNPDTVRIYPTVIIKGTRLGDLFEEDKYKTFSFDETIGLCAEIYGRFIENNIRVIRLGLNYGGKKEDVLGGNCSLQLGELCMGRYYYNKMLEFASENNVKRFEVFADKSYVSKINGQKSENRKKLAEFGISYKITEKTGIKPEFKID